MQETGNPAFEGQVALVTGASRGIGRTIAEACAQAGARVALSARDETGLDEAAEAIRKAGGEATVAPVDVTRAHLVDRMLERVWVELGPIDLLVNNAGSLTAIGPTWECDPDSWWNDVEVNLRGVFLCSGAVIPRMLQRGRGRIVNMVGGGTRGPFPFGSAYGCSKAAVMRLTETLAHELDEIDSSVRVFALSPGLVLTAMTRQFLDTDSGRTWMERLAEKLDDGEDVPPDLAAEMVVRIGSGELDGLHGRYLHSAEDLEKVDRLRERAGAISEEDRRTLRIEKE